MTNKISTPPRHHPSFVIASIFGIRISDFRRQGRRAFTLIELLVVMVIIAILAALVLSISSYVQNKGARARAEAEIAAMSAALESYKADNGIYPRDNTSNQFTDNLNAKTNIDPTQPSYKNASLYLYNQLTGATPSGSRNSFGKSYMTFKPNQLYPKDQSIAVTYISDPFGNSYGYSTANQASSTNGYNPTYDLWSTAGPTPTPAPSPIQNTWVKNW